VKNTGRENSEKCSVGCKRSVVVPAIARRRARFDMTVKWQFNPRKPCLC
jgi:hypothetical protein